MTTRKIYTSEFKAESVKMVLESDLTTYQVAKNLGISYKTLYSWVRKSMPEATDTNAGKSQIKSLQEELKKVKRQLKRTEQEREILKKAAAYFASQKL